MDPQELARRLQAWLAGRPGLFVLQDDASGVRLTEVATAKSLQLPAAQVEELEVRRDATTGAEYMAVSFATRPPLALSEAGFAFTLETRNTGPLSGAPPAMGFADYRRLHRHLLHLLDTQDDPEHRREALDITMVLIASLDGARAVGLAVDSEEAALEVLIRRLEAGA